MLWVSEYGKIFRGKRNKTLPGGDLELGEDDFLSFLQLLDSAGEATSDYGALFKYSRPSGQERLVVQNYAGVIAARSGVQIEILPKVSRVDDPNVSRELLLKMLISLTDSPFITGTSAMLNAHEMPILEVLMRQYLEQLTEIVRKGIARAYRSCHGNLIFLRGKLKLSEHIKLNPARQDRMYCEYDEYEVNRPINRLLKSALKIVHRLSKDSLNQQLCRELLYWFDAVPPSNAIERDLASIQRDRMISHYESAMPSCLMIIQGLNPLSQQGERRTTSMLFPMERIFESFVSEKLVEQFPSWRISTQVTGKSLVEKHRNGKMFGLRPDLLMRNDQMQVVADTKWKLINGADRSNNYGIKQSDIYQMYAYSKEYLKHQQVRETYLIYPKTQQFDIPLNQFWYQEGKEVLYVVPFDLENERLIVPDQCGLSSQGVLANSNHVKTG